jgi:hypothetical protein
MPCFQLPDLLGAENVHLDLNGILYNHPFLDFSSLTHPRTQRHRIQKDFPVQPFAYNIERAWTTSPF